MSEAAHALPIGQNSAREIMLTILNGREAGVAYKLLGSQVSMGRAADNDVVLDDSRTSRNHARIELRGEEYWIIDLGSQNGIYVNNGLVREQRLKIGDEITVGNTRMRFGPPSTPMLVNSAPTFDGAGDGAMTIPSSGKPAPMLWVVIGVVGIAGGLMYLTQGSGGGHKDYALKDENVVQEKIEAIAESNDKAVQEIMKKGKDTQQYAEAQTYYLKGFREFREGNFSRAIQGFEAALALFPEHPLAKRYLSRSRQKLDESISQTLTRAERYFQLHKYNVAFSEYQIVKELTNDPNNKNWQLADKRIEAIKLILMSNK